MGFVLGRRDKMCYQSHSYTPFVSPRLAIFSAWWMSTVG